MLTSGSQRSAGESFLAQGFSVFLLKPLVRPVHLLDALVKARQSAAGSTAPVESHSPASSHPTVAHPRAHAEVTVLPRYPARVLVAENNVVNQLLIKRMLEKYGCRIDIAANGEEAVGMVRRLAYDLVFMDCYMPVMDGFQATKDIRAAMQGQRHLPIVAFTANAMADARDNCLANGMDDYLSKPVSRAALEIVLERWIGAERPATRSAATG
jgi:CheY-like chemotaxis protein